MRNLYSSKTASPKRNMVEWFCDGPTLSSLDGVGKQELWGFTRTGSVRVCESV